MREKANLILLFVIAVLTAFSLVVIWPAAPKRYLPNVVPWPHGHGLSIGTFHRAGMRLGLDLRGGARIVVQADRTPKAGELQAAQNIYVRRVNGSGLSEAEVTIQGSNRIDVEVPGISAEDARNLIGKTAELRFEEPQMDQSTGKQATDANNQPVFTPACLDYGCPNGEQPLTGKQLKPDSYVGTDQLGAPAVNFQFNSDGAKIFGAVTQRNIGRPVAIYLDNDLISAPTVQSQITDQGQITGTNLQAQQIVAQLNAGALPLPFTVVQQSTVDATLGRNAVQDSVFAGEIGFIAVAFFMIAFYRLPGVLASLALIVYSSVVLMIFKLVPVTLTLPGIAAFVLSIGIAVDANILIFERTKEELRAGRGLSSAIDQGFRRAWPSIRDSNISTIMTSLILFWFGDQFGAALVKGFALNLAIGVIISLFSAILVTRLFLMLMVGTRLGRSSWMFGAQRPQYAKNASEVVRAERRRLPAALNLVGNRKWYYVLSIAVMVPGLISLAIPPTLRPGIEFTSGTTFTARFQQPPSASQLQADAQTYGFGDATVQSKGNDTWAVTFSQPPSSQTVQSKLTQDFSVEGPVNVSGDTVDFKVHTPPTAGELSTALKDVGHGEARVQGSDNNEYIVRVKPIAGNVTTSDVGPAEPTALDNIRDALIARFGHMTDSQNHVTDRLIDSDTVSAIVSHQIVKEAGLAVLVASLAILLYITWAFRAVKNPFRYGASAIVALLHDVIVVVGLFSIFGKVFGTEINTMFITGLLTVIGFSVHDTIVVFDRIRENLRRGISRDFEVTVNESLLQTLDRSLSTSLTVVFTLLALLLLGGASIRSFVLVLLIGIISGTYSSIAIASQVLVEWERHDPGPYVRRLLARIGIRRPTPKVGGPVRPSPRQPVV